MQVSQATREVLPLPILGDHRLSKLCLSRLPFYIPSRSWIKGVRHHHLDLFLH